MRGLILITVLFALNSCTTKKANQESRISRFAWYSRDSINVRFFEKENKSIIDSCDKIIVYSLDKDKCVKKFGEGLSPGRYFGFETDSIFNLTDLDKDQIRYQLYDLNNYEDGVRSPHYYFLKLRIDFVRNQDTLRLFIGPDRLFSMFVNNKLIGTHYFVRESVFTDWLMYRFYNKSHEHTGSQ